MPTTQTFLYQQGREGWREEREEGDVGREEGEVNTTDFSGPFALDLPMMTFTVKCAISYTVNSHIYIRYFLF